MKLEYAYAYLRDHIDQVAILCSVSVLVVGRQGWSETTVLFFILCDTRTTTIAIITTTTCVR